MERVGDFRIIGALLLGVLWCSIPSHTSATILDLSNVDQFGFRLDAPDGGQFGTAVSSAGDFNGDGIQDLIVGAPGFYDDGPRGAAYIYLGPISASSLPAIKITGRNEGELGTSVAAAGDVNADGFDDVLIGAPSTEYDQKKGRAYVLFGGTGHPSIIRANNLGDLGVEITGANIRDLFGQSVSGAGDVNGDGIADFIVGAPGSKVGGPATGAAVIVFGSASLPQSMTLSTPFDYGVVLIGENTDDQFGGAVSNLGDFNGDDIGDVIVGAPYSEFNDLWAGAAYVIHGGLSLPDVIDAGSLGSMGFRVAGLDSLDFLGQALAGGHDLNGDGLDDAIIGVLGDSTYGYFSGGAFLLFGSSSTEDTDIQYDGPRSVAVLTDESSGELGTSVAIMPDQNGDETPDLVIGAPDLSKNGPSSGSAFLVATNNTAQRRVINAYSPGVFRIDGVERLDSVAESVAYIGPIKNSATEFIAIGAKYATLGGSVYVVDIPFSANGFEISGGIDGVWFPQIDGVPLQDVGFVLDAVPKENNTSGQNLMVGAWFTHDLPTKFPGSSNRWITMQGSYANGANRATVNLYQVTDGDFFGTFPGITTQIGSGELKFSSCKTGRFEFSLFDGEVEGVWQLRRSFSDDVDGCLGSLVK